MELYGLFLFQVVNSSENGETVVIYLKDYSLTGPRYSIIFQFILND